MTVTYHGDGIYHGLSGDTKPTSVPANSVFLETDTIKTFLFNGTIWKDLPTLDSERVGKSVASGDGSTTVFNIAHGLGSNPTYAFVDCSSHAIGRTFTTDATNIVVTFASAPPTGTNNVIIYWRVVA